jgi:hypothetical protein
MNSNYSIRVNNLSAWEIRSTSATTQILNFRMIESILFRENLLDKISTMLLSIDSYYWKYCINRIKAVEKDGKMLNCEELVLQQNRLFTMQNEISVAIAHLRSISIQIIEFILKIRSSLKKEIDLGNDTISVFWKNENYLLKMNYDIQMLFEFQILRYWIGFIPNPLMIPSRNHNPFETWQEHTSKLYYHYHVLYKEKQNSGRRTSSSSSRGGGRKAAIQQDRKFVSDNLLLSMTTSETANNAAVLENNNTSTNLNRDNNSYEMIKSSYPSSIQRYITDMKQLSSVHHKQFEDWEQLRDYCSYSWGMTRIFTHEWPKISSQLTSHQHDSSSDMKGTSLTYVQEISLTPFFWNNSDHNPYIIETALCLKEVFPTVFLVPPLPQSLLAQCLRLSDILEEEIRIYEKTLQKQENAFEYQSQFLSKNEHSLSLQLNDDLKSSIDLKFQLKFRQQCDSDILTGIDSQHILESFRSLSPSNEGLQITEDGRYSFQHNASSSEIRKPGRLSVDNDEIHDDLQNRTPFITAFHEPSNSLYTQFDNDNFNHTDNAFHQQYSTSSFVGREHEEQLERKRSLSPSQFSSSLIHENQFKIFTLDSSHSEIRYKIENKIDNQRRLAGKDERTGEIYRIDDNGSRRLSPVNPRTKPVRSKSKFGKKFSREFSRLDMIFSYQHARNIQRMIRGYLGRKRFCNVKLKKELDEAVVKFQALCRGYLQRNSMKKKTRQEKIATFLIRKDALKKFRSAILISQFIRKIVNIRRLRKNEPILFDRLNGRGQTVTRHQTFYRLQEALDPTTKQALINHDSPYKTVLLRSDLPSIPPGNSFYFASGTTRKVQDQQLSSGDSITSNVSQSSILRPSTTEKSFSTILAEESAALGSPLLLSRPSTAFTTGTRPSTSFTNVSEQATRTREPSITFANEPSNEGGVFTNADSTELYEENEFSRMTMDAEERRKFEKFQAISLIKRLNANKYVPDSIRESRLIPSNEAKHLGFVQKKIKLSRNNRTFLKLQADQAEPHSLVKSANELYISPYMKPGGVVALDSGNSLSSPSYDSSTSLADRLQSKHIPRTKSQDSWSSHAAKLLSVRQEKEFREQEKFKSSLRKFLI